MPISLYWGEEEFSLDNAVKALRKKVLTNEGFVAINHKTLVDPAPQELIETVQTLPMMLGNLLVEVKASSSLVSKLIEAVPNIDSRVHLLFVCEGTVRMTKAIQQKAEVMDFPVFKSYQEDKIVNWVIKQATGKSLKVSRDAAAILVQCFGSELRKIDTELEKIKTAIHPKSTVSINEVKEVVATNEDIFKFSDYILSKNSTAALKELNKLLEENHPVRILATLQTVTRRWLKVKLKSPVNLPPFLVEQDARKLRNVSEDELLQLRERVKNTEFKIKSGELMPEIAMEMLCLAK